MALVIRCRNYREGLTGSVFDHCSTKDLRKRIPQKVLVDDRPMTMCCDLKSLFCSRCTISPTMRLEIPDIL